MKKLCTILYVFGIPILLAWLLVINPDKEYGWFMGIVHGALAIPNWIISLFSEGWLMKATLFSSAYGVWWWIALCASIIEYFSSVIYIAKS